MSTSVLPSDPLVASDGPAVSLDAAHDDTKTLAISKGKRVRNAVSHLVNSPNRRASRLPASLQFPLIVLLSFSFASLGYSFLNESTRGELSAITKPPESSFEVTILALWRMYVPCPVLISASSLSVSSTLMVESALRPFSFG